MTKPDFFIVGAPKCGTTALYDYLNQHPQVWMSPVKEPCFFGRDSQAPPAVTTTAAYLNLFSRADGRLCGEASTTYLASETAAEEIKAFNPRAKIIIMLREPASFLLSYHNQLLYERNEDIPDFADALAAEEDRRQGRRIPPRTQRPRALLYRRAAAFSSQVERYLRTFDRSAVHIILNDDFARDTLEAYRQTCAFLGIDPSFPPHIERQNVRPAPRLGWLQDLLVNRRLRLLGKRLMPEAFATRLGVLVVGMNTRPQARPTLDPRLRHRLQEEFRPEVERLAAILDRDLSHWLPAEADVEEGG